MSSKSRRQVERNDITSDRSFSSRGKEAGSGRAWGRATGLRLPSFFLLATMKLPGWRWTLPVVFPLFVVEDVLESAGWLMLVVSRLAPVSFANAKLRVHPGKDCGRTGDGGIASCGRLGSLARRAGERTLGQGEGHDQGREGRFPIEFSMGDAAPLLFSLARVVRALRLEGRFTLVHVIEGASGTEIAIRLV